jgi:hypothetical protein
MSVKGEGKGMRMAMDEAQVTLPSDREVKVTRSFRAPQGCGQGSQAELQRARADGEPQ